MKFTLYLLSDAELLLNGLGTAVLQFDVVSGYGEASVTVMDRMCGTAGTIDSYACSNA